MIDELIRGSSSDVDDVSPVSIETVAKRCQQLDMAWPYNHLDYSRLDIYIILDGFEGDTRIYST